MASGRRVGGSKKRSRCSLPRAPGFQRGLADGGSLRWREPQATIGACEVSRER